MPPRIVDLRLIDDRAAVAREAADALSQGQLVVFPTETVYGVAALAHDADAVRRLAEAKGRSENQPFTLAIRRSEESLDYAPEMTALASRLARRCWPGPVTLVLDASHPLSLVARLPDSVRQMVAPHGQVGLRVAQHEAILDTLEQLGAPLVLSSANRTGCPDAHTAQEAVRDLGDHVGLVLDGGPVRLGQASTVVRVYGDALQILREGAVAEFTIRRLAARMVLFVCTGNTCRSPLAEVFCEKMLAERLACPIDELEDRGHVVLSAGVSAVMGLPASEHSREVARRDGLSLDDHQTQPVTETMIRYADCIYTMTQAHRRIILSQWPEAVDRVVTLAPDGSDVPDPVGGPLSVYLECAEQIKQELSRRVAEWDI